MKEKVTDLSLKQKRTIIALLESGSITEASFIAKVSRKTIYVWLNQPEFRGELNRLGGIIIDGVASRMIGLASEAVETLSRIICNSKEMPVSNQIQAASIILKRLVEIYELGNLNRRIEEIESVLNNDENSI